MKRAKSNYAATIEDGQCSGEILILPDGRVLAHNITPALAGLLADLDPADEAMRLRAGSCGKTPVPDDKVRHMPDNVLPPPMLPPHSPL